MHTSRLPWAPRGATNLLTWRAIVGEAGECPLLTGDELLPSIVSTVAFRTLPDGPRTPCRPNGRALVGLHMAELGEQ